MIRSIVSQQNLRSSVVVIAVPQERGKPQVTYSRDHTDEIIFVGDWSLLSLKTTLSSLLSSKPFSELILQQLDGQIDKDIIES